MIEMTKFTDGLFDDLIREHGAALSATPMPAPNQKRRFTGRPVLLSAGAAGLALAATVGTLAASGGTPAYAVTANRDGTVSLAVYQPSGYAGANAKLREMHKQVVVVPVEAGCPLINTLPVAAVVTSEVWGDKLGPGNTVEVTITGLPAGDYLLVGLQHLKGGGWAAGSKTIKGPAPSCVSFPGPHTSITGGPLPGPTRR
jgi:hypothetical protein